LQLTPHIVDIAWRNYFGTSHSFAQQETKREKPSSDPLEL